MRHTLLLLFIAFFCSFISTATTTTWSGNSNSNWNDPANWIGGIVPGQTDEVLIPNGSNVVISGQYKIARLIFGNSSTDTTQFTIDTGSSIMIKGESPLIWAERTNIVNNGNLHLKSPNGYFGAMMLVHGSMFANNGSLTIVKTDSSYGGGIFMLNASSFLNNHGGLLEIDSSHIGVYLWDDQNPVNFVNNAGATIMMTEIKYAGFLGGSGQTGSYCCNSIENYGSINIHTNYPYSPSKYGYGVLFITANHCFTNQVGGSFTVAQSNPGSIKNDFGPSGCSVFNGPMQLTAYENNNNFTTSNGERINLSNQSVLTGEGKVDAGALEINSDINPGPGPAHITFLENYIQSGTKKFLLDIYGTNGAGLTDGNDLIEFQGESAILEGDLEVSLEENFFPHIGDVFELFRNTHMNGSILDQLNNIALPGGNEYWEIIKDPKSISIRLIKQLAPCDELAQALPLETKFISAEEVELMWEEVPDVDHYEIKGRQILPNLSSFISFEAPSKDNFLIIQGLDPQNTYEWMIRPHCDQAESISGPWSDKEGFTICKNPASTITIDITANSALLGWASLPENVYGYRIIGNQLNSDKKTVIDVDADEHKYLVGDLHSSTTYRWLVLQNCGTGVYSDFKSASLNIFNTLSAKTGMSGNEAFSVYPVPATDKLNIAIDQEAEEINIYDLHGKLIRGVSSIVNSSLISIDISDLEAGFYFIEVRGKDFDIKQKFVVNN